MFRAPEWTASGGLSYDTPIGETLMIGFDADMRYSSSYYVHTLQNPSSKQDGFAVVNAAARLYTEGKGWELALIGRNLTNKWYMLATDDKIGGGPGMIAPATDAPRTIMVRGTYSF